MIRYVYPFIAVGTAVLVMRLFPQALDEYVVLVFLGAVTASALYGGLGPGLLSIPLSLLTGVYFVIEPGQWVAQRRDWPAIAVYTAIAGVTVWLIARRQRAEQDLRALNRTLEERVAERSAELARSYEMLRQNERLAAIGEMVAGISHESRNALQRSLASLELLGRRLDDRPEVLPLLDEARKAQRDLQRVYEHVKDYAAPVVLDRQRASLPELWRRAWDKLAQTRHFDRTRVSETVGAGDPTCLVDPFRVEQVFRNLFENALDAGDGASEICVTCTDGIEAGRPVLTVTVCDNGPGLDEEEAQRIFEPFYTTKTKGTGLGLAIVRRIVEEHGGHVTARRCEGGGLAVELHFPRADHR